MSWTAEAVSAVMRTVGLDPGKFDLEATAADLQRRSDVSATLDRLVTGDEPIAGFDPRWD